MASVFPEPARGSDPRGGSDPRRGPGFSRGPVPSPPGGHALHVATFEEPQARRAARTLPVVDETSAGGLVVILDADRPRAAVIARRNRAGRLEWCLPKGHVEGSETVEEAAIREIAEETGIRGEIVQALGIIDYWFTGEDRRIHKVVHHFLLSATGGELSVAGDPDGEAEDAAWVAMDDLVERLAYPNERRLAAAARAVVADCG